VKVKLVLLICVCILSSCAESQIENQPYLVGGSCEGCEGVLEYPDAELPAVDTLPDYYGNGPQIRVEGKVYDSDGKTPVSGVILYVYHTNQVGRYAPGPDPKGWENQHGYIRAWLKTDESGYYAFYTLKPAPYPSGTEPAHIHYTILEPDGKYYWIHSAQFPGDGAAEYREIDSEKARGGPFLIIDLKDHGGVPTGRKDVILGKNIPNYGN